MQARESGHRQPAGTARSRWHFARVLGTLLVACALVAGLMCTGCAATGSDEEDDEAMTVDASYIEEHAGEFALVDVRTASEYAEGHIPGAVNIPYSASPCTADTLVEDVALNYDSAGLAADDAIVVYCKTGVRATAAYELLVQAGYTDVAVYEGSWADWTADESRAVEY